LGGTQLLVGDLGRRGAHLWADRPALTAGGRTTTYGELWGSASRMAELLGREGAGVGTRVALLSWNLPECLEVLFAASWIGAVVVPLNARLTPEEIRFQVDDAGVTLAVVDPALEGLAADAGLLEGRHLVVGPKLDQALAEARGLADRAVDDPEAPCIQLYTSGTTGRPKGALLTNRAWVASTANVVHGLGLTAEDRLLGVYPFFHVAGLGFALGIVSVGGQVVVPPAAGPDAVWATTDEHRLTLTCLPGMSAALSHPAAKTHRPFLRGVIGGANMEAPQALERLGELLPGARFYGVYGSTEAGNLVTITSAPEELERPGTIGRPLPCFDVAILDEHDAEMAPGEVGELALRGPSTMSGYWHLPDETAKAQAAGWLHTGDLMRRDGDGYLYFVDRSKDMVKTGGENVYSIEIETVLAAHPEVADVAVIGVPDRRWGEAVKAVVVASSAHLAPETLDDWCRERLAPFKRPRWYELVDAIPRSTTGKILKRDLRASHDAARAVRLQERT